MERTYQSPPVGCFGGLSMLFLKIPCPQSGATTPKHPFPRVLMIIHWTPCTRVCPREVTSSPSRLQHNRHQGRLKSMLSASGSAKSTCTSCFSSANQKMERQAALGWGEEQGRGPRNTHTHRHSHTLSNYLPPFLPSE